MTLIATDVDDSIEKLRDKLASELTRPNHAIDSYFYRSHLVHDRELEHLIFKIPIRNKVCCLDQTVGKR